MARLHGGNSNATQLFLRKWNEGTLNVGGRSIIITKELISRVMDILIIDRKF